MPFLQDVPTRWSSTFTSAKWLVYLKPAIKLNEMLETNISPLIKDLDWAILKKVCTVLTHFQKLQKLLEGENYVTGSLLIPLISDLRNGLEKAANRYSQPPDMAEEAQFSVCERQARAAMRPCVTALLRDMNERWGDGKDVTTPREGRRRQPRGFTSKQVLAIACDPRLHETLHGIPKEEHDKVWNLLHMAVADQAVETARKEKVQRETQPVVVPSPRPAAAAAAAPEDATGGEAEDAAEDEHEPLEGLFAVSK